MKTRTLCCAALITALATAAPAAAAPVKSPEAEFDVFTCAGGIQFTLVTIAQNQATAVQILSGTGAGGVFHLTRVSAPDGTVVFNIPGQTDKTEAISCTDLTFPGYSAEGFFTPRP
jgi:hypothetical protein